MVLGDIHSEYRMFMDAVLYAKDRNLTIISVGDLVDYGPHPKSTVHLARTIMVTMSARFIEGNHDNKVHRYIMGNDVVVSKSMEKTVADLESDKMMKDHFSFIMDNSRSYDVIGDTYITHGAFSKTFWEGDVDSKEVKRAFLYGEVDYDKPFVEFNGQKYPHRVYDWADHVPSGKTVIVGHDRTPLKEIPAFGDEENTHTVYENKQGGKVIWIDTGAGKGGHLSGAVLNKNGEFMEIVTFQ